MKWPGTPALANTCDNLLEGEKGTAALKAASCEA